MKKIIAEIDRRNMLKYLGNSALFYPFMRTMFETQVFGANVAKRAVFFYFPSGIIKEEFHPKTFGANFDMPTTIAPLAKIKSDIVVLSGVDYKAEHHHGGGCKHALTGAAPGGRTESIDSYLAEKFKSNVRLPAVRLGVNGRFGVGEESAISYNNLGNPTPVEDDPRKSFEAIFGGTVVPPPAGTPAPVQVDPSKGDKSVLDFCVEDIKSLQTRLGTIGKQKLDLHLQSVRELERRIQQSTNPSGGGPSVPSTACTKQVDFSKLQVPANENQGSPFYVKGENFDKVANITLDIATQALACGVTNVVFIHCCHSVDDLTRMDFVGGPGVPVAQHTASHHGFQASNKAQFALVQAYFMRKFGQLAEQLKAIPDGDKSLLYNSVALAFSEVGDPNAHDMENVGLVLAGQAGGRIKTGQAIDAKGYFQNHVLVSVLQAMGLPDTSFGNSAIQGTIPGLLV